MSSTHSIRGPFTTYDATAGQTVLNDGGIFRIRDIAPDIPFKRPYSAMFYKFLSSVPHGNEATQDKVEYGQQEKVPNFLTVKADATSGATSLTVTNAYNSVAGDKLINMSTGEQVRLDAIDSATQVSVAAITGYGRGFAGTTAAAMVTGNRLYKMGNSLTERGRTPDTVVMQPTSLYNYCSYYVKAVSAARLQENAVMLGNFGKIDSLMADALFQFQEEMNLDLWKGRRSLSVVTAATAHDSGGGNLYQMNGFDEQVHNAVDLSGSGILTWEVWNEILSPVFDNYGDDRMMFCGKNVMTSIMASAKNNTVLDTYPTEIEGVNVTAINVDGGTVHLVRDYDGLPPGSARVVHMGYVEYRPRVGMETQWIRDTKLPTQVMETVHTLLAGGTLVVRNQSECHLKIDNVSGPFNRGLVAA